MSVGTINNQMYYFTLNIQVQLADRGVEMQSLRGEPAAQITQCYLLNEYLKYRTYDES